MCSSYVFLPSDVPDAVNVSSIEVTNTTFDTISIQWTPPNNNFDSIIDYRVVLYGSGGLVGEFTPFQPMVTLVSLQPFTTYQIRISARNNAGWGGNSSERNVNTLTRGSVCVCVCVCVCMCVCVCVRACVRACVAIDVYMPIHL